MNACTDKVEIAECLVSNVFARLSQRELECLYLAALGKRSYEIAVLLSIKKSTVDGYKKQIFKRLDALSMCNAIFKVMSCPYLTKKLNNNQFHFKENQNEN